VKTYVRSVGQQGGRRGKRAQTAQARLTSRRVTPGGEEGAVECLVGAAGVTTKKKLKVRGESRGMVDVLLRRRREQPRRELGGDSACLNKAN